MDLQVIIPTLNEEKTIADVIEKSNCQVLIVDGGSKDSTVKIAKKAGAQVIFEPTRGNGAAFKKGVNESKSEYIACIDGDSTYDSSEILSAFSYAKENKLSAVFGDRLSKKENHMRAHRKLGNILTTEFLNLLFGINLKDSQSGFFIIRKDILTPDIIPKSDRMSHVQELKIRIIKSKITHSFIPISYNDRDTGSKFNFFLDGFGLIISALKLRMELQDGK